MEGRRGRGDGQRCHGAPTVLPRVVARPFLWSPQNKRTRLTPARHPVCLRLGNPLLSFSVTCTGCHARISARV